MADRILTFHSNPIGGDGDRIGATFYMEADYDPIAVRIHAEGAPDYSNARIDIFDDDVSIFTNQAASCIQSKSTKGPTVISDTEDTSISLMQGDNTDEIAERLNGDSIDEGSWVYCKLVTSGGGRCKNLSVHLELAKISEDDESPD
jgi:hypothetical protein